MLSRLSHGWRALKTCSGFIVFYSLSIGVALTAAPLARLRSSTRRERELRVQVAIQGTFRFIMWYFQALGLMTYRAYGVERLQKPGVLVVANHPTLIDTVAVISHMRQADCVAKPRDWNGIAMGGSARAAGYIPSAAGAEVVVEGTRRLHDGRSLVIFPEGTRSPMGALGSFQRGAAHVALAAGVDILPVVITCVPPALMKGQKWWDIPERPFEMTLRVEEPIRTKDYIDSEQPRALAARQLTNALHELYEKRLESVKSPNAVGDRAGV